MGGSVPSLCSRVGEARSLQPGTPPLQPGQALKIPLSELPDTKENIRSALNRATRQMEIDVSTSSDAEYFYVWTPDTEQR